MNTFAPYKVVSALPSPLVANALYAVRVGTGFDLYLVDSSGANAFKINAGDNSTSYLTTIYGDAEAYAFVLNTQGLTTAQLNAWLNSQTRIDQFTTLINSRVTLPLMLADASLWSAVAASTTAMGAVINSTTAMTAVAASSTAMTAVAASTTAMTAVAASTTAMTAVINSTTAMTAVINSTTAMTAVAASSTAMTAVINSTTAMTAVINSTTAMTAVINSTTAMTAVAASSTAMTAVAASTTAMTAVAASAVALSEIAKSASAATSIELALQSYRAAVISTLDAATTVFGKVVINIGDGPGTFDAGGGTSTLYIPTSCYDDNDTVYYVQSPLRSYASVVSIAAHSWAVPVTTGLTLRGVRVYGTGSSVGNVTFNVYTAV